MSHTAPTDHPIHDLLRQRWSPYAFDPDRGVNEDDLRALFEAAHWTITPSGCSGDRTLRSSGAAA